MLFGSREERWLEEMMRPENIMVEVVDLNTEMGKKLEANKH